MAQRDSQPRDDSQAPALSRVQRAEETALVLAVLVVGAAILAGIGFGLFLVFKGLCWATASAASYVGAIGWWVGVPIACLALFEAISRFKQSDEPAPAQARQTSEPKRRVRMRPLLCAAIAAILMSGNLSLNIAASRVEEHWKSRQPHTLEIYKNHDLAKLVGQCVRLAVLRHAGSMPESGKAERRALEAIATIAPERWAAMTDPDGGKQPDPRVLALADAKLTEFIREPRARALHHAEWLSLLTEWRTAANAEAVTPLTLAAAAETIAADLGITLREALKADFEKGGKAWAAMQLDIAQQLLNQTPVSLAKGNSEINAALAEVKTLMAADAKALDALNTIISDVRQSQEAHAKAVEANFDEVIGRLAKIQADVTVIKDQTTAGLTNDAINARIKQIDIDPALSVEQKREQMQPLLAQIINNQPANAPKVQVPAPVQQAVERTFAGAPKIVRFAALARVGLDKEADALAAEIERTTAGLSEADKYEFFVARADRFWNANDYWNAATWYAQAMALRVDDPAVVHRAARSTTLAPGKATYTRDVQLAQSWVERCIAKLAKQPGANVVDTARLHATLAITLVQQGRDSAGIVPAREALRLLPGKKDAPAGQTLPILFDAAVALGSAGVLPEAAAAADRAVDAAETAFGPGTEAAKMVLFLRAGIRQNRGDIEGAEADIQKSIAWCEAQSPRNERRLAADYFMRAQIRHSKGDLAGAEDDFQKSFTWFEAQSPRDERFLAIWYASRASIRETKGDLAGAEEDIQKSTTWFEAQSPRDERQLVFTYAVHAEIRQGRNDLAGAEEDLAKAITWCEAQLPRDERLLALLYELRAKIERDQTSLDKALASIQSSIDWTQRQIPLHAQGAAVTRGVRATIYAEMNRLEDAKDDIAFCIAWHAANQPSNHRVMGLSLRDQARIFAQSGMWDQAAASIAKALPLHEQVFGKDHEWTKKARAWQASIAKQQVPPRWPDTTP